MLYILTGDVQTGKTAWLARAVDALTAAGVRCDGVLAPGVWDRRADGTLDKLGIDNVLLPGRTRVPFARRADLARAEGTYDERSQAARASLGWHISDEAIRVVNRHFDALAAEEADREGACAQADGTSIAPRASRPPRRVLIVDELGQLELARDEGLTSAVGLLKAGPRGVYAHACVIVRDRSGLAEEAERRFADAWHGSMRVSPDQDAWKKLVAPFV